MAAAEDIGEWLARAGLAPPGFRPAVVPLSGGVSSDVFRVDLPGGPVCVKQALEKLKVAADWRASPARSGYEAAWLRAAADAGGPVVPEVLAEDPDHSRFAMTWFAPEAHPVWKAELAAGRVDVGFARAVGEALVRVHAATAGRAEIAAQFPTDALFRELRISPYLLHTAERHTALAGRLQELAERTLTTRKALVHGDVSPKNILHGPAGPVFLDAECAWYGDPAFDLAFCLNHLLLKSVWKPEHAETYLAAFRALALAYLDGVAWEPPGAVDLRAGSLLGGLLLARVDGKSPVEYLTTEETKAEVRAAASAMLRRGDLTLVEVEDVWTERRRAR